MMDLPEKPPRLPPDIQMIEMFFKPASHWPASRVLIGRYAEGGTGVNFFLHLNLVFIIFDYWQNINKKSLQNYYLKCLISSKRHFTLCLMEQHCAHTTVFIKTATKIEICNLISSSFFLRYIILGPLISLFYCPSLFHYLFACSFYFRYVPVYISLFPE